MVDFCKIASSPFQNITLQAVFNYSKDVSRFYPVLSFCMIRTQDQYYIQICAQLVYVGRSSFNASEKVTCSAFFLKYVYIFNCIKTLGLVLSIEEFTLAFGWGLPCSSIGYMYMYVTPARAVVDGIKAAQSLTPNLNYPSMLSGIGKPECICQSVLIVQHLRL